MRSFHGLEDLKCLLGYDTVQSGTVGKFWGQTCCLDLQSIYKPNFEMLMIALRKADQREIDGMDV
jgi:hypothetical protein